MRPSRRLVVGLVCLGLAAPASSWCADARSGPPKIESPSELTKPHHVVLETDRGPITIELFPDVARKTVARFIELAKKGFYDGQIFYRVVPNFLVQAGDPGGDGTGGAGRTLPAEFNEKKHIAGTVGMARQRDPDSADSQFYITLEPQPFLDGRYTVFGQVVEGLNLLPQIKEGDTIRKVTLKP